MNRRIFLSALALATFATGSVFAQNPLANKKFVAGLIATNAMNVASVRFDATAGADRYAIAINYGLGAHQVSVTVGNKKPTVMTLCDGVSWIVRNGGKAQAAGDEGRDLERGIWMTPAGVYKAAQFPDAKAVLADTPGPNGTTYMTLTYTAVGVRLKATITDKGLVDKVETLPEGAAPGAPVVTVSYGAYKDVDGIQFPTRITEARDGKVVRDLTVTDIKPNAGFYVEPPAGLAKGK